MHIPQLEKYNYMQDIPPVYKRKRKALIYMGSNIGKKEIEDSEWSADFFRNTGLTYNILPINIDLDHNNFTLPYELKHVASSIEKSKYLLGLNNDWDDEDALATNIETYVKAIKFIVDYSTYIFQNINNTVIDAPDIDILKDGSIIVSWENELSSFTIIFEKIPTEFSYYYGKVKNDKMPPLRYGINTNLDVDKITTAPWMANNLKYKLAIRFH